MRKEFHLGPQGQEARVKRQLQGTRDLAGRTFIEDSKVERAHGSNTGGQGLERSLSGRV